MTPLETVIREMIITEGPISVARYMQLCLGHPTHGYYMTRDPFGERGDFTTAPEISQMFGEIVGAWVATLWEAMDKPKPLQLVELGPGRGTLMADVLRVMKRVTDKSTDVAVNLVETSPFLRKRQAETLARLDYPVAWHDTPNELPDGRVIVIANEFFDALPVQQYVKQPDGWHERMVGIGPHGRLCFALNPHSVGAGVPFLLPQIGEIPDGTIYEWRRYDTLMPLTLRLATSNGVMLVIDYGPAESGVGDTLQAVSRHGFVDPLAAPGEADLTAHVDFSALAFQSSALRVQGPITQGEFLRACGITQRAAALKRTATPAQLQAIDAALTRLTGGGEGMGELFKVMCIAPPWTAGGFPGFERWHEENEARRASLQ